MNDDQSELPLPRASTHVCLISAQATPNLTPILDPDFAPSEVVMITSPDMVERARRLSEVLKPRGIKIGTLDIPDAWDMNDICDRVLLWLDSRPDASAVALNVTGGTKPMAMAAQQAFAIAGLPVFYVHQDRDEVLWLMPRRPAVRLSNRLKLEPYLHAHGWGVLERPDTVKLKANLRKLTDELVLQIGSLEEGLGRLNWYASQCESSPKREVTLEPHALRSASFMSLLEKFSAANACELKGDTLGFPDEEARFFCNGGWLEVHVADVLNEIRNRAGLQDLASGLKVRALDNRLVGNAGSNELDVAFLAGNRLHIIECKTRSFRERHSAAEAVYKLDSLTALGGLNTRGMLISYRKLMDGDRQRARDLGIRTVIGQDIANLRHELIRWIELQKR